MGTTQIVTDLHELVEDYDRMLATVGQARERALRAIAVLEGDIDVEEVAAAPVAATPAPTAPKPAKAKAAKERVKYDYAQVAAVANGASGQSQSDAVMDRFGVSRSMSYQLISEARRRGHAIVKATPMPRVIAPESLLPAPPAVRPVEPQNSGNPWTPDRAREALEAGAA